MKKKVRALRFSSRDKRKREGQTHGQEKKKSRETGPISKTFSVFGSLGGKTNQACANHFKKT